MCSPWLSGSAQLVPPTEPTPFPPQYIHVSSHRAPGADSWTGTLARSPVLMLSMHFISLLHSSLRGALDACGAQGVQSRGCPPPLTAALFCPGVAVALGSLHPEPGATGPLLLSRVGGCRAAQVVSAPGEGVSSFCSCLAARRLVSPHHCSLSSPLLGTACLFLSKINSSLLRDSFSQDPQDRARWKITCLEEPQGAR